MEKLTLSIRDPKKVAWAKAFAQRHQTSVSRLFEEYLAALATFDDQEVVLSESLNALRHPGPRPSDAQIARHLTERRKRTSAKRETGR